MLVTKALPQDVALLAFVPKSQASRLSPRIRPSIPINFNIRFLLIVFFFIQSFFSFSLIQKEINPYSN